MFTMQPASKQPASPDQSIAVDINKNNSYNVQIEVYFWVYEVEGWGPREWTKIVPEGSMNMILELN